MNTDIMNNKMQQSKYRMFLTDISMQRTLLGKEYQIRLRMNIGLDEGKVDSA